jgi:hypothetical protein
MRFNYIGNCGTHDILDEHKLNNFIQVNDHTTFNPIESDDVILIGQINDNDDIFHNLFRLPNTKIVCNFHEYIHLHIRYAYLEKYNNIKFLDTHLDLKTFENDLPLHITMYGFNNVFSDEYKLNDKLSNKLSNNRNIKLNFFNRSISLRRAKIFEILLKNNITFDSNCSITMGLHLNKFNFADCNSIEDYISSKTLAHPDNKCLNIDSKYLNDNADKFTLLEDISYHDKNPSVNFELKDNTLFDEINKIHIDSYVAFIIESSGDFLTDCRYTEKTIRPFLYKNIFFTIGSNGFNAGLKERGIQTFNDLFGLDDNWDDTNEIKKVNIFASKLMEWNTKSIEEIKEIYNRKDIQQRLENNYKLATNAFSNFENNLMNELK